MTKTIIVTKHALEQYRRRILQNPSVTDDEVSNKLVKIFKKAQYISDNENGILFRNRHKNIEFIVKQKKIITLYPINFKNIDK